MKHQREILTVLGLAALLFCGPVRAQQPEATGNQEMNLRTYANLLRQDVRAEKMTIITQIMAFTPEEASVFWPVYADYDRELAKIGEEKIAIIQDYAANYGSVTDQKATELVSRALGVEEKRTALKRKYFQKFSEAMSPKSAARFLQVENQLLMLIDLQVASSLPVVE